METKENTVVVYEPGSPLRNPLAFFAELVRELIGCKDLIVVLFFRDLKAQYRQSFFGYIWTVMPPLAITALWAFLNNPDFMLPSQKTPIPYPVFVLTGTTLWSVFQTALQSPLQVFQMNQQVFMKLKIPHEAFLVAGTARALVDVAIRLVVLIPVLIIYNATPSLSWTLLLVPFGLIALFLAGFSIGTFLIPIGSLYNDIQKALNLALPLLMYTTPVVFPPPQSLDVVSASIRETIVNHNPFTHLIMATRNWLTVGTTGEGIWGVWAWAPVTFLSIFLSIILLFFGLLILRSAMPHLVARMGM